VGTLATVQVVTVGRRGASFDRSGTDDPDALDLLSRQVPPDLLKVNKPVDRPQQVVGGDMLLERELIEPRSLFDLPVPIMIFSHAN